MSARVIQIMTADTNRLEVAYQDYELAKQEVDGMLLRGFHRTPRYQERFQAAVQRRAEARRLWLRTIGT